MYMFLIFEGQKVVKSYLDEYLSDVDILRCHADDMVSRSLTGFASCTQSFTVQLYLLAFCQVVQQERFHP